MADIDSLKDIPGYKAILKSILKSQIQLLIEQLSNQTGEETIILTASVHDGTLSHLGSQNGKGFLEGRDEIKSQFLGYCLKTHHKPKAPETKSSSPYQRPSPRVRSPTLQPGPSKRQKVVPVTLVSRQPHARPSPRLQQRKSASDTNTGLVDPSSSDSGEYREVLVKQEYMNAPASDIEQTETAGGDDSFTSNSAQLPSSLQLRHTQTSASNHGDDIDRGDAEDPNDQSLVKVEPITQNEMELEITGVEMGEGQMAESEDWDQGQGYGAEGDTSFNPEAGDQSGYKVKAERRQYSQDNMERALQLVKDGVSKYQAAKLCGVPRSTLHDKWTGRTALVAKMGVRKVLSEEEEEKVVGEILLLRQMGCPMGRKEIVEEVKKFIDNDGRKNPFKYNVPGKDWYYSFLQRHPELKEKCKTTEITSLKSETLSVEDTEFPDVAFPDVTTLRFEPVDPEDPEYPHVTSLKSEPVDPDNSEYPNVTSLNSETLDPDEPEDHTVDKDSG